MALQVWLPLNGDLKNKGCADITVINNGATVSNNGKIGKCYSVTASQYIEISNLPFSKLTNCSISLWIKVNSIGSNGWLPFAGSTTSYYILATQKGTGNFYHSTNNVGKNTIVYKDGVQTLVPGATGEWHHYVVTGLNLSTWTKFYINHYNSAWNFAGSINDIRIYDHHLSPKEVKEISQGLVLHYKLDDVVNPNLLPSKYWRNTINGSTSSNEFINLFDAKEIWDTYGLVPYTVSFDAKSAIAKSFPLYGSYGTNNRYSFKQTSINITTEWQRFTYTFTPYSTNESGTWAGCSIYGTYGSGAIPSIRRVKLELGSIATPMNGDDIITDSSGYNNNGTINGTLTLSTDSPRYKVSTGFNNTSYIRVLNRPNDFLPKDAITVNLWAKWSTWGNPISCTQNGGWNFEFLNTTNGIQFPVYSRGYRVPHSKFIPSSHLNEWHMITGTFDKNYVRIYIDGEMKEEAASGGNPITYYNNYLFIAAEADVDTTTPTNSNFVGNISDVRIYSTALSANDILQLYRVGASIDNMGNVHSYEIDETSTTKTRLYKTGIFETGELIEGNDKAVIEKNVDMDINEFIEV